MHVIQLPHHLDECPPSLDVPLRPAEVVTAEPPPADVWERPTTLYSLAGRAVADAATRGADAAGTACCWHPGHGAAARTGPHLEAVFGSPG